MVVGGHLADVRGRRVVGAIGVVGGTILSVLVFTAAGGRSGRGPSCRTSSAAAVVPALGVYRPELFPTGAQGGPPAPSRASPSSAPSSASARGRLVDRGWTYGPAFLLAVGPLVVAVLMLTAFPETAHMSARELNPEDQIAEPPAPAAPAAGGP